jgi:nucleotide-binding universal stress UspA family protein
MLFGSRIGRLTLVAVVPFDATPDAVTQATENLERARKFVPAHIPVTTKLEIVEGHPATALRSLAARDGYDVLTIGTRGSGMSKRLIGSTASELARATDVPVLLVDDELRPRIPDVRESIGTPEAASAFAVAAWAGQARST